LQHKNGETGALVVENKYRGRGLGGELLKRFNGVLFEKNSILFALVEKNNIASAKTMVNGGYKKVRNNIMWVYRMKNGTLYLP
jgi:predicted GNAT family acetyltransferase